MSRFQTDSLNPTALNTGVLGRKRAGPSTHTFLNTDDDASGRDPDAERNKFAADWNTRIDKEMRVVSGGLKELVELADIGPSPAPHTAIPNSLHLKIRTAQLIRATQSIRDMAHELRLMLLLSDETGAAARRDAEAKAVGLERERHRKAVLRAVGAMTGQAALSSPNVDVDADGGNAVTGGIKTENGGGRTEAQEGTSGSGDVGDPEAEVPGTVGQVKESGEMEEDSDEFEEL